jgi:uncharacterized protein (DUF4415 family)
VNNTPSLGTSKTDWARVNALQDDEIDFSDAPEATEEQMARAVFRVGGVPAERGTQAVNLLLDRAIVEYFKGQADDQDYQALIRLALLDYMKRHPAQAA